MEVTSSDRAGVKVRMSCQRCWKERFLHAKRYLANTDGPSNDRGRVNPNQFQLVLGNLYQHNRPLASFHPKPEVPATVHKLSMYLLPLLLNVSKCCIWKLPDYWHKHIGNIISFRPWSAPVCTSKFGCCTVPEITRSTSQWLPVQQSSTS